MREHDEWEPVPPLRRLRRKMAAAYLDSAENPAAYVEAVEAWEEAFNNARRVAEEGERLLQEEREQYAHYHNNLWADCP